VTCAILTPERIDHLLRGTVPAADRRVLLDHLSSPCESCLDLLSGPAGDAIVARLGGDGLTAPEADRIFSAAAPAVVPTRARRPRIQRWVASIALAAAGVAIVVSFLPKWHGIEREDTRLKGTPAHPAPEARLIMLAGKPLAPESVRLLQRGEKLGPREVLLVRIRISAPAFVYLVGIGESGPGLVLWPDKAVREPRPAGEFELARAGDALSIDPRALGRAPQIALIASPRPLEPAVLSRLPRGREQVAAALPDCGVDVFDVELQSP